MLGDNLPAQFLLLLVDHCLLRRRGEGVMGVSTSLVLLVSSLLARSCGFYVLRQGHAAEEQAIQGVVGS
jgi:hypothetical protein